MDHQEPAPHHTTLQMLQNGRMEHQEPASHQTTPQMTHNRCPEQQGRQPMISKPPPRSRFQHRMQHSRPVQGQQQPMVYTRNASYSSAGIPNIQEKHFFQDAQQNAEERTFDGYSYPSPNSPGNSNSNQSVLSSSGGSQGSVTSMYGSDNNSNTGKYISNTMEQGPLIMAPGRAYT